MCEKKQLSDPASGRYGDLELGANVFSTVNTEYAWCYGLVCSESMYFLRGSSIDRVQNFLKQSN